MISIQAWITEHSKNTELQQSDNGVKELRLLLCHVLEKNQAWLYGHTDYILQEHEINQLNILYQQLTNGVPLAYITGSQAFWDIELSVNKHTLIPRPDTETLIETCIALIVEPPATILDLGTGSGAIAISLAKFFNKSNVLAVDASNEALNVAKNNSQKNGIHNIQFLQSNWFNSIKLQQFDLIVSNPPYIAENDPHLKNLTHEPIEALIAAENGLADFKRIASDAFPYLKDQGILVLEHGWQQKADVQNILKKAGFANIKSFKDLAGQDRVSCGYKLGNS